MTAEQDPGIAALAVMQSALEWYASGDDGQRARDALDASVREHAPRAVADLLRKAAAFDGIVSKAKDHHEAMAHEMPFESCDHGTCLQFRWLLAAATGGTDD